MDILVIGNGFDLEHNLPTKYWDFMMFIKNYKNLSYKSKEEMKQIPIFKDLNENVKEYLLRNEVFYKDRRSSILKELDTLISYNIWIKYFEDKVENNKEHGWIDFESEISEVIQALEYFSKLNKHDRKNSGKDYDEIDEIKDTLGNEFLNKISRIDGRDELKGGSANFYGEHGEKIVKALLKDLNDLIRCLEIYIGEVVELIDVEHRSIDIEGLNINKVISFNYSNTYKRLYEKGGKQIEYDYIHGKVQVSRNADENNMVLGVDEYLKDDLKDKNVEFIKFKKYFQRIYKNTTCNYKRWVRTIKKNSEVINADEDGIAEINTRHNLYVFGHSIDVTDKDILRELILTPNLETTIFYYDKDTKANYIANLVKIIGQDELNKRAWSDEPTIIFKQQCHN